MEKIELTPMQRQYRAIKRDLPPGAILMFRLGDFYEMFGEDAVVASPILGATLTQRAGQPMCGIPYHALDAYLAKLIRAGKTAALCDQMEDPRTVKKGMIVRREVPRIVTPGTVTEDGLLDADANCYIAAVSGLGLALLDLSTGEFAVEPFDSAEKLADALARGALEERERHLAADAADEVRLAVGASQKHLHGVDAACVVLGDADDLLVDGGKCLVREAEFGDGALDGLESNGEAGARVSVECSDFLPILQVEHDVSSQTPVLRVLRI